MVDDMNPAGRFQGSLRGSFNRKFNMTLKSRGRMPLYYESLWFMNLKPF